MADRPLAIRLIGREPLITFVTFGELAPMPKTPNGLADLPPILPGWGPGGHVQPRHLLTAARSATAT